MRLIDADKLIDYFYYGIDDKPIIDGISDRKIIDIIKNQPTAYYIDKVVEEFDKMYNNSLSSLKDGELEDYKHIKQWKSDIMDAFCKYDCNSVEEARHNGYNTGYKEAFEETLATVKFYADMWDGIYKAIDELEDKWKEWESEQ